jgi:pimeloyl-ACP methyl ester carboxylesterase
VEALKGQAQCVVPDHIGCGLSDKPQDYAYTLAQHVENMKELVDHLQLKSIVLVVHDWGGAIGMGLTQHLGDRLKGIIINNTAAYLDKAIPKRIAICRAGALGTFINRGLNGFVRAAVTMAMPKGQSLPRDVADAYVAPYDSWHNRVAINGFVKDIPMETDHPSYPTLKAIQDHLPSLNTLPKLIFWGEQDFCFNMHFLQRWRELWPDAEVHSYPEAGHYLFEIAHEKILAVVLGWIPSLQPLSESES